MGLLGNKESVCLGFSRQKGVGTHGEKSQEDFSYCMVDKPALFLSQQILT
jgi:hypothetical protein